MHFEQKRLEEILKTYKKGAIIPDAKDEAELKVLNYLYDDKVCQISSSEEIKGAKLYPQGIKYLKDWIYNKKVENSNFLKTYEDIKFLLAIPLFLLMTLDPKYKNQNKYD